MLPLPSSAREAARSTAPTSCGWIVTPDGTIQPQYARSASCEDATQRVDDPVLLGVGEVGEQRQADQLAVRLLGDRAEPALVAGVGEDGVPVHRDVVDLD